MAYTKTLCLLLIVTQIDRCSSHAWTDQKCSTDTDQDMPEGITKNIDRFPWLGVVQHAFRIGSKTRYAIANAVLIHSLYAVAAAEDVAKIPVKQLANNTQLIFWGRPDRRQAYALDVRDYILHPQYKSEETFASIALLSLIGRDEIMPDDLRAPVMPVCLPLRGGSTFDEIYSVRMTDETGDLQKSITRMDYVESKQCEDFYYEHGLLSEKYNPVNPVCAMATHNRTACVWDAGIALIVRQSFGFWQLIGLSVRGPGCGVPTKFLNIHDYLPWINDVITNAPHSAYSDMFSLAFRRLGPYKLIMYNPRSIPTQLGQCDREDRGNVLYKDWGEFTANKDFVMGFFLVVVSSIQSVMCGEITMTGANQRSHGSLWMEHNCHAEHEGATIQDNQGHRTMGMTRKLCFAYFKTSAFMEFRFTFSFHIVVSAVIYGKEELKGREVVNPFKSTQYTTEWWPTDEKLRAGYFATNERWWYNQ